MPGRKERKEVRFDENRPVISKLFVAIKIYHKRSDYLLSFLALAAIIIFNFVLYLVVSGHEKWVSDPFRNVTIFEKILGALLLAPIIETLIFQYIPHRELKKKTKGKKFFWFYIIVSTSLFAVVHLYSWYYVLYAIFPGCVLAALFFEMQKKTNYPTAFYYVTLVHFSVNLLSFIMDVL